ncbi:insulinase family protein [Nocardiopsis kunsanensis]|uniref:insulinase family protein n=1 Tax=Nocardiopsis kunsanensis TaxID=141693 RepID=UPI001875CB68|nr:insulinase family protein [Nocardiopsis kunsanensis]
MAQSIGGEVLSGLYGPTSPHGHLIGGSRQSLEQLTVADIERFHQSQYVPKRTVVVVTGDVDHDMVLTQAQKFFPDHPRGVASRPRPSGQVQVQHGSVRSPRESHQTHVAVAVEGVACTDPCTPAQNILGAALGGLRSSQTMDAWERGRDRAEELFLGEMGRGRPVALSEDLAALNAVTLEDLHKVASQLCSRPQLTVLLGNV